MTNPFHILVGLCDFAFKSALIVGAVELLLLIWRENSAATRHAIRFAAILASAAIPIFALFQPALGKPLIVVQTEPLNGNELSIVFESSTRAAQLNRNKLIANPQIVARSEPFHIRANWPVIGLTIWAAGALLLITPILIGWLQCKSLLQRARPIQSPTLDHCRNRMGIRRNVKVRVHNDSIIPIVWGVINPIILLPTDALEWTEPRLRAALLHELAHVKRWDCLTQFITQIVCALVWPSPLLWRAARKMREDREIACDDLVIQCGCAPADYATELVQIARLFRNRFQFAGIGMARPSQLQQRIASLMENNRSRRVEPLKTITAACAVTLLAACVSAQKIESPKTNAALRQKQLLQLEAFAALKEKQAEKIAAAENQQIFPEFREFFAAAKAGDWQTVTNKYASFKRRHPQYNSNGDLPATTYWSTILEICLGYFDVNWGEPDHVQLAVDDFMRSIPAGSVYFGGTDPGRGLPTAFSRDHTRADPFFTLTQNALADSTYLEYIRKTYGDKLALPSDDDSRRAYEEYLKQNPKAESVGQNAVMQVNARIAKQIFDANPKRDFYIEQSFPLEWMNPRLSPHGLVLKVNREPLALSPQMVNDDFDFWAKHVSKFVGGWLTEKTSIDELANFAERVHGKKDLTGFKGDPRFVQNDWAQRAFSKWRCGMAHNYAWRAANSDNPTDRQRMKQACDLAFKQAYALCPYSPEVVFAYTHWLATENRKADAKTLLEATVKIVPNDAQMKRRLEEAH